MEIILVGRGEAAPGSTTEPFLTLPSVVYLAHVQSYGWMDVVVRSEVERNPRAAKQLESIKIWFARFSL